MNPLVERAEDYAVRLARTTDLSINAIADETGLFPAQVVAAVNATTHTDRRPPMTQPLPVNHPDKRIANLAMKIQADRNRLQQLVAAYDAKAETRSDVARLEAELAAAKAKLRGAKPAAVASVTPYNSAEVRRWANDNGVPVPKAGIVPKAVLAAYLAATA